MNRILATATAALLLGMGASGAEAAQWSVDPAKSKLGFGGTQTQAPFSGRFKTWSAAIDFDPANPQGAHLRVSIDLASAATGDPQKDEAMPGADWFDVGSAATARFEADGFTPKGGDAFETSGTLTLRGTGKPVTLPFTLSIAGDTAHAVGRTTILRTDFGVGQGSWATGDMVGLDVAIDVDLVATKK